MPGIGAGGFLGVGLESVAGTYVPPTKFVPIQSESLQYQQETIWRRPIRQSADIVGAVDGNVHVEGDISMEAFEDVVAVMLLCARTTCVKTGTGSDFTYKYVGAHGAIPARTMSVTVVRNGQVFAYTGVVLSSFTFTIEDGLLMFNVSCLGRDEATQSAPLPVWETTQVPFGAGKYNLQIPTATTIFDADTFEFQVDDGGEAQFRLKSGSRGAQFIAYGERAVTLSIERDFENRTDYEAFKALTAQSVTLEMIKSATRSISLLVPAAIKDSYELGLSGQGDLIRASIAYNGVIDSTGKAYELTVKTGEDITV